jgi:hypothetical protein
LAGYSQTPLFRKLGIKPGHAVALVNAPDDFDDVLGPLPDGVSLALATDDIDVALLFVTSLDALTESWQVLAEAIRPAGGLWVCWPKKASGVPTDLNENIIREFGLAAGLVDNKVCAVDETWSGLRFVYRLKDR